MPFDIGQARRDTPAADQILHFNNAGAALMPAPVLQAQLRHLRREADLGGYEAAAAVNDQLEATYDSIAQLLNAGRSEIALVESATVAWDMAFYQSASPRRPHSYRRGRIRQQLHRLPPDRPPHRRRHRNRAE